MIATLPALLVLLPILTALVVLLLRGRAALALALAVLLAMPALLVPLTAEVWTGGVVEVAIGGWEAPLGIRWRVDALAVVMLWLNAVVGLGVTLHSVTSFRIGEVRGSTFWALWLILVGSINALFLSADLFNLYVTLELVTLSAVGMITLAGKPDAMFAAMRYLLLGLLASLLYLLATGMLYGQAGTLDLYQLGDRLQGGPLAVVAITLLVMGLLLKSAIFPLHVWLPAAHGNAPGPVSAVLSALVVKTTLYILIRLWFWTGATWELDDAGVVLGALGAAAILYGSVAAFTQERLKMMVAYSTVAQLGYIMLIFPLASAQGFRGATLQIVSHGVAKAAMFLAAANILRAFGTDELRRIGNLDRRAPLDLFAFGLAGVSIMGLPPSGGFLAKWLLLTAAWEQEGWIWMAVLLVGSLLAAAYVFRVIVLTSFRPGEVEAPGFAAPPRTASGAALSLALGAIALGVMGTPFVEFVNMGLPPGVTP